MATVPSPGTTGNDTIVPGTGGDTLYGDPYFTGTNGLGQLASGRGGNDILSATGDENHLIGDAGEIAASGRGGNDRLSASGDGNFLFGDAGRTDIFSDEGGTISGTGRGGNDSLSAEGRLNWLFGDAADISGSGRGGNDVLSVTGSYNALSGDGGPAGVILSIVDGDSTTVAFHAGGMFEDARGGNDSLSATGTGNSLAGDGGSMSDNARGGNDSLSAAGDRNILSGDAGAAFAFVHFDEEGFESTTASAGGCLEALLAATTSWRLQATAMSSSATALIWVLLRRRISPAAAMTY